MKFFRTKLQVTELISSVRFCQQFCYQLKKTIEKINEKEKKKKEKKKDRKKIKSVGLLGEQNIYRCLTETKTNSYKR